MSAANSISQYHKAQANEHKSKSLPYGRVQKMAERVIDALALALKNAVPFALWWFAFQNCASFAIEMGAHPKFFCDSCDRGCKIYNMSITNITSSQNTAKWLNSLVFFFTL